MIVKSISLHPKFAAAVDFVFGLGFLLALTRVDSFNKLMVWLALRAGVWAGLVVFTYYPAPIKKFGHWLTLAWFGLGMFLWLIFIDWSVAWYVVGLVFAVLPAVSFWLIPSELTVLTFITKSYRRWRFLMFVAALAGMWSAVGAAFTLQLFSPFSWWLSLIGALLAGAVAAWWWREYELPVNKRFWLAAGVLILLIFELDLVVRLWPLGYFVSGLFLTWTWYLLWLMFRFFLTPEGLSWKKQRPFLIANGILLIIYLGLIVRWR